MKKNGLQFMGSSSWAQVLFWELDVPLLVCPLKWFFCFLGHGGSFHLVPFLPNPPPPPPFFLGALVFILLCRVSSHTLKFAHYVCKGGEDLCTSEFSLREERATQWCVPQPQENP